MKLKIVFWLLFLCVFVCPMSLFAKIPKAGLTLGFHQSNTFSLGDTQKLNFSSSHGWGFSMGFVAVPLKEDKLLIMFKAMSTRFEYFEVDNENLSKLHMHIELSVPFKLWKFYAGPRLGLGFVLLRYREETFPHMTFEAGLTAMYPIVEYVLLTINCSYHYASEKVFLSQPYFPERAIVLSLGVVFKIPF